ncbi:hypothetical protein HMPREF3155_00755 [Corynebacterium sp. HMSC06D04]|uniref:TadE-like family protein n=1 Tax=Corynebacterium simulans TaxID=146827 RepID=A0ABR5VC99_9CORY|nr:MULTISPECIES: hypothetical protein [Corynebacterium]AMO91541.1 hypothetical protein AWU68_1256 [Corynebacterium simulans]KXU19177.1 hypothetical protein WM41_0173 [Corynebacterium simulans]MCG7247281.1 hypothetical protein [Corynebacterium simulans]MDK7138086.1 hypothetical protein [Corynebacterium simulans]OFQ49746.1 hypothetical protein HMPREF2935_00405 [Corynebacterium sp. HMSC076D02]
MRRCYLHIVRRLSGDTGSVTIEAALGLSSLVIVAAGAVAGVATMAAHLAAVDAAGAAARAYAIGEDYSQEKVSVDIAERGGLVTAQATVRSPLGEMKAQAVFPAEIAGSAGGGQ